MSYSEDINNALIAHGQWKQRLVSAIASGKSEFSVAQVQVDNMCAFGKWFYSLPAGVRQSERWKRIQQLHTSFHQEAAKTLSLALGGRTIEARKALDSGSQFVSISGQLAIALTQWQKVIDQGA